MDAMDPYTLDPLARPPPAGLFGPFSGAADCTAKIDAYLRAIGALPPADSAPASVELPGSCELYDSGIDTYVRPAVDVPARRPPPPGFPALPVPARAGPVYATPIPTLRASLELPVSCELYVDAHVQPANNEVPVQSLLPARAAPASDGATSKNSRTRPRLCASTYDADINANLRATEKDPKERPCPDYMTTVQGGQMSPLTRANLVIWIDTFARHFDLAPGTLHCAVSFVDRFLSVRSLTSHSGYELRLLGSAAVFTAAKYEEQRSRRKPTTDEIALYGGFTTTQEVLDMESAMLPALGYRLSGPTAYTFVERFTMYSQGEQDLQVQCLARLLADQSLLHHGCLSFLPSAVAASAIFLARLQTLSRPDVLVQPWNRELQELTGYKPMDLIDCVHCMYVLITSPRFALLGAYFEDP